MDNLIKEYILTRYLPDLQVEIFRAFTFFTEFNYVDHELPFINLLMAEDLNETQELQDQFFHVLTGQQETIFKAHLIKINNHSTIFEKNEILDVLLQIQNRHDYSHLEAILHSTKDEHHAFALIVEHLSSLDEHRSLELIEDIDHLAFNELKNFVYKQTLLRNSTTQTYTEIGQRIVSNMRSFIQFTKNENLLGRVLMDDGVLLDQPVSRYRTYFKNTVFENKKPTEVIQDILSLLYLENKGIDKPLESFRTNAGLFFSDLSEISQMEQHLNTVLAEYATFLKVEDEKAKLLQASNPKQEV